MGETFSGVPYDVALQAVEELRPLVPQGTTMAAFALRWILMEDAVSVVIPGARRPDQALANAGADALAPLPPETMQALREIYELPYEVALAEGKGVKAKAVVSRSDIVSDAIIAAAKKQKADLVVMASHGRKGIKRLLLGSETQQVLTHCHVPVLVLR